MHDEAKAMSANGQQAASEGAGLPASAYDQTPEEEAALALEWQTELVGRQLQAMRITTPAQLAEVLAAPGNRDATIATAHKLYGNAFVVEAVRIASERSTADAARNEQLTQAYGLRPRRYGGYVDGTNAAEAVFRNVVPQAVAFINQRAEARKLKFRLSVAELVTNFIAEGGGARVLNDGYLAGIDGFSHLGIDTFIDRYDELRPWIHPSITRDKVVPVASTNEKGERVHSIGALTLVQAIYASAAMLAHAKAELERGVAGRPGGISKLTDRQQQYLTTVFFNAGPGFGRKLLAQRGPAAADRPWSGTDDHATHNRNAHFNATVRGSTYASVRDTVLDDDRFRGLPTGDIAERVRAELGSTDALARHFDEQVARDRAELAAARDMYAKAATEDEKDGLMWQISAIEASIARTEIVRANLPELFAAMQEAAHAQLPPETAEPPVEAE